MGLFRRKVSTHLIRIHPDNATSKDWVILWEAATIVGLSPERLRVAPSTLDERSKYLSRKFLNRMNHL